MTGKPHNHIGGQIGEEAEHHGAIPDKRYFKIGEVCDIAGVKQHVLRYWESEFRQIVRPQRATSGQRLYRRIDVVNILRIKKLLKEDGLTILGAKRIFACKKNIEPQGTIADNEQDVKGVIHRLKSELQAIQKILQES